jgi:hypothetical protein
MPSTKPPPENPAKVGENGGEPPTTIERFRRVLKGLLAVTPAELKEEERRYREGRETTPVARRGPPRKSA